jgi:hypothetical protein
VPSDADFDLVSIGSYEDNLCTPDILDDTAIKGIRIAAPRRVALEGKPDFFGNFARAVVCGAYRLPSNYLGLREKFLEELLFVAVDATMHEVYSGMLDLEPELDEFPAEPDEPIDDADWEGRSAIQFFNPNLVSILGLPQQEAEYIVYVCLGDHVSNVVRMALVR